MCTHFFKAFAASVPNLIEIGGVTRKTLVDLTRNDPQHRHNLYTEVLLFSTSFVISVLFGYVKTEK